MITTIDILSLFDNIEADWNTIDRQIVECQKLINSCDDFNNEAFDVYTDKYLRAILEQLEIIKDAQGVIEGIKSEWEEL